MTLIFLKLTKEFLKYCLRKWKVYSRMWQHQLFYMTNSKHTASELLHSLHWLPIDKRIMFKIILYVYKSLNDLSPVYLTDCLKTYVPPREGLRSSLDTTRLVVPRSSKVIGDRSFGVLGPKLWNDIPAHIRVSQTVGSFKCNLKTYLYWLYFSLACLVLILLFLLFL